MIAVATLCVLVAVTKFDVSAAFPIQQHFGIRSTSKRTAPPPDVHRYGSTSRTTTTTMLSFFLAYLKVKEFMALALLNLQKLMVYPPKI